MSRFALVVTAMLAVTYAYVASRLAHSLLAALALAVPFVLIWIMPVVYWGTGRSREGFIDQLVHRASYLSMAWVSFILVFTIMLDLVLMAMREHGIGEVKEVKVATLETDGSISIVPVETAGPRKTVRRKSRAVRRP